METLYRLLIMFEKNYELIKFHVNWADELDIDSVTSEEYPVFYSLIKEMIQ